jgi:hypothetical protein
MSHDNLHQEKPMPAPPEDSIDSERLAAAHERWTVCPLKDCKSKPDLLYEDFFLRDVRSNRVMCSKCAVHTEVGYMAREAVEGYEPDKPYDGKRRDYLLILLVALLMSVGIHTLTIYMPYILISIFVGIGGGLFIGYTARRLILNRVGRFSGLIAAFGVILGLFISPIYFFIFSSMFSSIKSGAFTFDWISGIMPVLVMTGLMAFTAFLVFLKR